MVKSIITPEQYSDTVNLLTMAYNCGALQYHPFTVYGITFVMVMHSRFNRLTAEREGITASIVLHGSDSEEATEASLASLVRAFTA